MRFLKITLGVLLTPVVIPLIAVAVFVLLLASLPWFIFGLGAALVGEEDLFLAAIDTSPLFWVLDHV